ncbi:MAG: hypothetical protein JO217_10990 [Acidobacteriaceae bacterium]|nr:hypothetical protein [Acidobacteriaceae bacterium]MBV9443211.1 hypothetical protein [Acidobacteriaceae bacterium]
MLKRIGITAALLGCAALFQPLRASAAERHDGNSYAAWNGRDSNHRSGNSDRDRRDYTDYRRADESRDRGRFENHYDRGYYSNVSPYYGVAPYAYGYSYSAPPRCR